MAYCAQCQARLGPLTLGAAPFCILGLMAGASDLLRCFISWRPGAEPVLTRQRQVLEPPTLCGGTLWIFWGEGGRAALDERAALGKKLLSKGRLQSIKRQVGWHFMNVEGAATERG